MLYFSLILRKSGRSAENEFRNFSPIDAKEQNWSYLVDCLLELVSNSFQYESPIAEHVVALLDSKIYNVDWESKILFQFPGVKLITRDFGIVNLT
jgi:hypothetical protein